MKTEKMKHRAFDIKEIFFFSAWSCNHYHIKTLNEFKFIQPVALADQPGQSVPDDTVSDLLAD